MKKTRNTIIFIIIAIIILYPLTHGFEFIKNAPLQMSLFNQSQVSNFKKYKNDYNIIANFMLTYKQELYKTKKDNFVSIDYYPNINAYNFNTREIINMSSKEQKSLKNVYNSFDGNETLDRIYFYKNKLFFLSDNYSFAIVYSPDGKKPKQMGLYDDEDYNFYVKTLSRNWYSITGMGK